MLKEDFLIATAPFAEWLAGVIRADREINFIYGEGVHRTLSDALQSYCWPPREVTVPTPSGLRVLPRNANLQANSTVLDEISLGLRDSLAADRPNEAAVFEWMRATMIWGGVYSRRGDGKGNAGWLEGMNGSLANYMRQTIHALRDADDDGEHGTLPALRSNAGTTKIHSLALPDFIIYDSRVAAALAWLTLRWAGAPANVPDFLQFACMRANTTQANPKIRSPHQQKFPYFAPSGALRNHHRHAMWNLRASWLLRDALDRVIKQDKHFVAFRSVRDVEAALFMMGDDLLHAV